MQANQFPVHLEHAINQFKEAAQLLGQLGFTVFGHVAFYASDDQHFTTFIESNLERRDPRMDHAFGDAIRDLSIKWHERTHDSRLEFEQLTVLDKVAEDLNLNLNLMRSSVLPHPRDLFGATPLGAEGGPEEEQRKMAAAAAGN